jgi:endoglucanase
MSRIFVALLVAWAALIATTARADLIIYADASQNGFNQGCSFGGNAGDFDFANASPVHSGSASIRFTPDTYNAVSWCAPATYSATTDYAGISFWVYLNNSAQGANIDLVLNLGSSYFPQSLQSLHGSAIPAGTWVEIQTTFATGPLNYAGNFDKISLQDETGTLQADVYFDDVALQSPVNDDIFKDGFEAATAPTQFRGTTITGMESGFNLAGTQHVCLQPGGPVAGTDYPVQDTRLIDYFASKNISMLRPLFAWECMQPVLNGSIPGAGANYQAYFNAYKMMVDYATDTKGIGIIIEPWEANSNNEIGGAMWNGNLVGSAQVPRAAFADFWSRMATIFKDNPRVSFGLMSEPNHMSTSSWFASAQAAITAIRATGSTQRIYVPGNAYTGASTCTTANAYGGDAISNADGWLNANGAGVPLSDPLNNIAVEVHTYVDCSQGGLDDGITSNTAARDQLDVTVQWARPLGLPVYLGEIGMYAGNNPILIPEYDVDCPAPTGTPIAAWADFINYADANTDTLAGFTWWAGGYPTGNPPWWSDVHAAHFSITPTNGATFTGDSIEMTLIQGSF